MSPCFEAEGVIINICAKPSRTGWAILTTNHMTQFWEELSQNVELVKLQGMVSITQVWHVSSQLAMRKE